MKSHTILHVLLCAAVTVALSGAAIADDEVVLENMTHKGRITAVDANSVTIAVKGPTGEQNEFTFKRAQILKIKMDPPASVSRGLEAFEKGDLTEARLSLGKVVTQYQGLDTDWAMKSMLYYGISCLAVNDAEKAEKAFTVFVESYPDNPRKPKAVIGLARVRILKKDYAGALEKLQAVVEPYDKELKPSLADIPFAAEAYVNIGRCFEELNKPVDALDAYLRVSALYPSDEFIPEALYRAATLVKKDQKEKALVLMKELSESYKNTEYGKKATAEKIALEAAVAPGPAK